MLSDLTPDPELTLRVHDAIAATQESDPGFWKMLCDLNDPRVTNVGGVLSIRPGYTGDIGSALKACEWSVYEAPGVSFPRVILRTFDLAGSMGVVDLRTLPLHLPVRLLDVARTGLVEAYIGQDRGAVAPFTTITLGPRAGREIVWTFHPGPPVRPSVIAHQDKPEITVEEALKLGLKWARCST